MAIALSIYIVMHFFKKINKNEEVGHAYHYRIRKPNGEVSGHQA